jgi:hypothetical protein
MELGPFEKSCFFHRTPYPCHRTTLALALTTATCHCHHRHHHRHCRCHRFSPKLPPWLPLLLLPSLLQPPLPLPLQSALPPPSPPPSLLPCHCQRPCHHQRNNSITDSVVPFLADCCIPPTAITVAANRSCPRHHLCHCYCSMPRCQATAQGGWE